MAQAEMRRSVSVEPQAVQVAGSVASLMGRSKVIDAVNKYI
jgi:hypothetical protein